MTRNIKIKKILVRNKLNLINVKIANLSIMTLFIIIVF